LARIERRLRGSQPERPAALDESYHRKNVGISENILEGWHERYCIRRRRVEPAVFGHLKEGFVRMLPGVTALVVSRRPPAGILVIDLPERLPLKVAAVSGFAMKPVEVFAEFNPRVVVSIRQVQGGSVSSVHRKPGRGGRSAHGACDAKAEQRCFEAGQHDVSHSGATDPDRDRVTTHGFLI